MPLSPERQQFNSAAGGCLIGGMLAIILCAYPLPAATALILLGMERFFGMKFTQHPGAYIYPVTVVALFVIPIIGTVVGVLRGRR